MVTKILPDNADAPHGGSITTVKKLTHLYLKQSSYATNMQYKPITPIVNILKQQTKTPIIGGGDPPTKSTIQAHNMSPAHVINGPLLTMPIQNQHNKQIQSNTICYPDLPINQSDHPIDMNLTETDISHIITAANKPANALLHNIEGQKYHYITINNFCDLISHGKAIHDSILHQYLSILCKEHAHIFPRY
jgi:hypothetical protein